MAMGSSTLSYCSNACKMDRLLFTICQGIFVTPQRSRRMQFWNLSPQKRAGYQTASQAGPEWRIQYLDNLCNFVDVHLNAWRDIDRICCRSGTGERGARARQVWKSVVGFALQKLHLELKAWNFLLQHEQRLYPVKNWVSPLPPKLKVCICCI